MGEVPQAVLVEELMQGPRAQYLALATRERKQFSDERSWREEVAERAAAVDYDVAAREAAIEAG